MCSSHRMVPLGFTDDRVPEGTHICIVYSSDQERQDCLQKFLLSGVTDMERSACFSDQLTENILRDFLDKHDISYDEQKERQALSLFGAKEVYFKDGVFDPDRMLDSLSLFYDQTVNMGFSAARVIGEMDPDIQTIPGGSRLLEYESRVSMLLRSKPVTAVCQYDARVFSGSAIMDILKVHPQMIVNGSLINNPFFIDPETFLHQKPL